MWVCPGVQHPLNDLKVGLRLLPHAHQDGKVQRWNWALGTIFPPEIRWGEVPQARQVTQLYEAEYGVILAACAAS